MYTKSSQQSKVNILGNFDNSLRLCLGWWTTPLIRIRPNFKNIFVDFQNCAELRKVWLCQVSTWGHWWPIEQDCLLHFKVIQLYKMIAYNDKSYVIPWYHRVHKGWPKDTKMQPKWLVIHTRKHTHCCTEMFSSRIKTKKYQNYLRTDWHK